MACYGDSFTLLFMIYKGQNIVFTSPWAINTEDPRLGLQNEAFTNKVTDPRGRGNLNQKQKL
jgi:hypothetical protein